jgi:arabinoxylan arabinofuranohydrolase
MEILNHLLSQQAIKKFTMRDWHVFSTTDMQNWTDHGMVFSLKNINWADSQAWASDCIDRNGKYYFYYPVEHSKIGVALPDKPYGPFTDPFQLVL